MGREQAVKITSPAAAGLPAEPDTFVGRERDLRDLRELLGHARAVTLCAPGGMGKTRLAVHLGLEVAEEYADGCRLVELAPVGVPELVTARVADRLGIGEEPGRDRVETLADALRNRTMLLILDNCEHLIDAAAELSARLLASAPGLHLLATSREPLRIPGETVWRLPPLTVPAADEAAVEHEAVRLFTERAAAVRPSFRLTPDVTGAVARVCRALDGMPLAIELAAARASVLSPKEIADRLSDRFRLLTGGDRTAPERQRTLRAAVDWSHDLLDVREQVLFRRLSVFAGGFTLAGAEAVCADGDLPEAEVFDLLTSLVNKSLVFREQAPGEGSRFRMLETIRAYAAERLANAAETERLGRAHRDHLLAVAETMADRLVIENDPADPSDPLALMDPDYGNLIAALTWTVEHDEPREALRLVRAAAMYWGPRGINEEALGWLERILALDTPPAFPSEHGAVLTNRAQILLEHGDVDAAVRDAERAIALAGPADRLDAIMGAYHVLGTARLREGAYAEADGLFQEGLDAAARSGSPWLRGVMLSDLGGAAVAQGRLDEAEARFGLARDMFERHGLPWGRARALISLGMLAQLRGDLDTARTHLRGALAASRESGVLPEISRCLVALSRLVMAAGDTAEARTYVTEAITRSQAAGQRLPLARALALAAEIAARDEDHERAVRLAGASARLREAAGGRPDDKRFAALTQAARERLGDLAGELWREGLGLDADAAVRLALEPPPEGSAAAVPPPATSADDGPAALLTAREQEVARLVARGMSNREIATELYISPATAARHVANIFTKLDLTSRTQLATWAVAHDLV